MNTFCGKSHILCDVSFDVQEREIVALLGRNFSARHFVCAPAPYSFVIVDHHLDLALGLSDRTVALETGAVTHVGPSKALFEDLELRRKVLWL